MVYSVKIILAAVVLFFFSCGSGSDSTIKTGNVPGYKIEAVKIFGSGYDLLFNEDSSFVVCKHEIKPSPKFPQSRINFFIYDINKNKKVFGENLVNGSVKWQNKNQLKIIRISEAPRVDNKNAYIYYYDVRNGKVTPAGSDKEKLN